MLHGPIRFTNALAGTPDFIYPGPAIDMQSPASANAINGATYVYYAQSLDMKEWEIGSTVYNSGSGTFARTTITANSLGTTAKINFTNPPQVMVLDTATDLANFVAVIAQTFSSAQQDQARSNINANRAITFLSNVLGADVNMNDNAFHDGPSCAQGTVGTFIAFGAVNVLDTLGAATISCKLHDGTTVAASSIGITQGVNLPLSVALFGIFTSPAGNIRISCLDSNGSPSGRIKANTSGVGKDSYLSVLRIA